LLFTLSEHFCNRASTGEAPTDTEKDNLGSFVRTVLLWLKAIALFAAALQKFVEFSGTAQTLAAMMLGANSVLDNIAGLVHRSSSSLASACGFLKLGGRNRTFIFHRAITKK
jgi:hypothetical protein